MMGTSLSATLADVQQSGGLTGKNMTPPSRATCTDGSSRARTRLHVCCQDIPRAVVPALSLLAAGQGVRRVTRVPCPVPSCCCESSRCPSDAHLHPTLPGGGGPGLATCIAHRESLESVTVRVCNAARIQHQRQMVSPSQPCRGSPCL